MNAYFNPDLRMTTCIADTLQHWNHANLSAPYWRLYWNRNEGAYVKGDGRVTPLDPGHFVMISPNTPFEARNSRPVEHLYMHFVAPPPYSGLPPSVFRIPIDRATRQRAEALFELSTQGKVLSNRAIMLAFSLIHQALAHIPEELLERGHCNPCVLEAMRWMEASPELPPSNEVLAKRAHMNINAFIRLFKRQTGVSPQAYGVARRVEQACLLLHHSAIGIKEIAERTGFCDRYHFTRVFTRIRGVAPATFRQQTYSAMPGRTYKTG